MYVDAFLSRRIIVGVIACYCLNDTSCLILSFVHLFLLLLFPFFGRVYIIVGLWAV
jgi:hypothetical protein